MGTIIMILVIVMVLAFTIGSISWHCLLLQMNAHGMPLRLTCLNDRLFWIKYYKRCKNHEDRKEMQILRKTCNWSIAVSCCMFVVVFFLNMF